LFASCFKAFIGLCGYTSDAGSIHHALLDKLGLSFEDAKFALVSCSVFINIAKASKAGVEM
jgi:hypothetical protein